MIADRWGVTASEVAMAYPCDAFVDAPAFSLFRGVSVAAPAEVLWPWLLQIGVAPYSYDWIDNLGRRSPRRRLDLDEPQVGDRFVAAFGRRWGEVLAVTPGRALTGVILSTVMSYVIAGAGPEGCRLLLKLTSDRGATTAPLLAVGDLVMARRQLLNLAALAEGRLS